MSIKELFEEGAKAYRDNKDGSDNPYEPFKQFEDFAAWQHGYRMEKEKYEPSIIEDWDSNKHGTGPLTGDY